MGPGSWIPSAPLPARHRLDRDHRGRDVRPRLRKSPHRQHARGDPGLHTEGKVTLISVLATAVLLGLVVNAAAGWWRADPLAGYVLVYYAAREVFEIFTGHEDDPARGDAAAAWRREGTRHCAEAESAPTHTHTHRDAVRHSYRTDGKFTGC